MTEVTCFVTRIGADASALLDQAFSGRKTWSLAKHLLSSDSFQPPFSSKFLDPRQLRARTTL